MVAKEVMKKHEVLVNDIYEESIAIHKKNGIGSDDVHYKELILTYLKKYGKASKKEIEGLLVDKLSDVLNDKQKRNKVQNLLSAMAGKDGTIRSVGAGRRWHWELVLDAKMDI